MAHEIEIGKIQEPFRVIFRAVRGIGYDGHIALDDMSLDYCNPGNISFLVTQLFGH